MAQRRSRSQRLEHKFFQLANQIILGIVIDDLTRYKGDAIVNAANERMLGGGGVDGAIHRAAGRKLLEACRKVPEVSRDVRCPTGEARITPGFDLPAKFVIHTVGPVYHNEKRSRPLLESAFRSSLELAGEHNLSSVAFPAISCGVYGYPIRDAAQVAVKACLDFSNQGEEVRGSVSKIDFVLFSSDIYEAWVRAAEELVGTAVEEGEEEGKAAAGGGKKAAIKAEGGGAAEAGKAPPSAEAAASADAAAEQTEEAGGGAGDGGAKGGAVAAEKEEEEKPEAMEGVTSVGAAEDEKSKPAAKDEEAAEGGKAETCAAQPGEGAKATTTPDEQEDAGQDAMSVDPSKAEDGNMEVDPEQDEEKQQQADKDSKTSSDRT